jgi:hypothetical protein
MRNTLTLIPTLMPAMRPSGMDGRTDSAYFGPVARPRSPVETLIPSQHRGDGAGSRGGLVLA